MVEDDRLAAAERALAQAAAVVALRRRGLARRAIGEALGMSDNRVWVVEYALGMSDNADDKMASVHPRKLRLVSPAG